MKMLAGSKKQDLLRFEYPLCTGYESINICLIEEGLEVHKPTITNVLIILTYRHTVRIIIIRVFSRCYTTNLYRSFCSKLSAVDLNFQFICFYVCYQLLNLMFCASVLSVYNFKHSLNINKNMYSK
jgi:hypothetical protein